MGGDGNVLYLDWGGGSQLWKEVKRERKKGGGREEGQEEWGHEEGRVKSSRPRVGVTFVSQEGLADAGLRLLDPQTGLLELWPPTSGEDIFCSYLSRTEKR